MRITVFHRRIFRQLFIFGIAISISAGPLFATDFGDIDKLIGPRDSMIVSDPVGSILFSKNENIKRIPASIFKIFTSLAVLHYLGQDYRFATTFYLDAQSNLKIKGYGDPLLISEVIHEIARSLKTVLAESGIINDLVLDDTYFSQPLTIPGISSSPNPYDAPNGALCVNFNTVFFKRTQDGYASAEPQTPLLPFALKKIKQSKHTKGRIVLSHHNNENTIYAGKLFRYYLEQQGLQVAGSVRTGAVNANEDKHIYTYRSIFSLKQIIAKLLEHSNNFTTNQLLITAGAKACGQPGNLDKGVAAARAYAATILQITDMNIVEGSGISRNNRITANHMNRVLEAFAPYYQLMQHENSAYFKTGTLHGISTRAGYIEGSNGGLYRFVVMINTPGKSARPIMRKLLQILE
jgi:D-alanyl-D-alanine carboxypeptidase/D-alanyl-D-alanine-endopeptidase (penicillin-binding protein 4)